MKFSIKIVLIFLFGILMNLNAQNLDRKNLLKHFNAEKNNFFVINGLPYFQKDSVDLDKKLKQINKLKLSEISFLKNDGKLSHTNSNIIIINYAELLSQKTIKKKFKEIKPRFQDEYQSFSQHLYENAKNPVLYLNGEKIQHTEATKIVNKLRRKDIGYIYTSKTKQNPEYHGQNAKNGIVIIWTAEKL